MLAAISLARLAGCSFGKHWWFSGIAGKSGNPHRLGVGSVRRLSRAVALESHLPPGNRVLLTAPRTAPSADPISAKHPVPIFQTEVKPQIAGARPGGERGHIQNSRPLPWCPAGCHVHGPPRLEPAWGSPSSLLGAAVPRRG